MLASNLNTNASYKKVRSISEGNFHSCYASNKAEKFKFRRMSNGLESCAQAQALKLRKEEKELVRLYQNIEKEKMKNDIEKRHNQFYLKARYQKTPAPGEQPTITTATSNAPVLADNFERRGQKPYRGGSIDKLPNLLSSRSKYNSIDDYQRNNKSYTRNKGTVLIFITSSIPRISN